MTILIQEHQNNLDLFNYGLPYQTMKAKADQRGGAGRGQGRKPLEAGNPTVVMTVKMTTTQREKLDRLGGAPWVRERIDKAKEPKTK